MVGIDIHVDDALALGDEMGNGDGGIVEEAEARRARWRGVVQPTAEVERDLAFARQQSFRGLYASASLKPGALVHPTENGVIPRAESIAMCGDAIVPGTEAAHSVDVLRSVEAHQFLIGSHARRNNFDVGSVEGAVCIEQRYRARQSLGLEWVLSAKPNAP